MSQAVVNLMKVSGQSIIASNKIAVFLATELKCPLIDCKAAIYTEKFDRLWVVNGPMLYCNFREELKELVRQAKDVVWVMNDYAIQVPKYIKEKSPVLFSSCENRIGKWRPERYFYVNWNQLTFYPQVERKPVTQKGLCYYGAFRPDRLTAFRKYLSSDLYRVHISSSKNGRAAFDKIAPAAKWWTATDVVGALGAYEACLYVEDEFSHEVYTSPANRFYEALSAHTLQLFDRSCERTFQTAGIDITPWIVDSPAAVAQKLSGADFLREKQMQALRGVNYRARLQVEFQIARKMSE